MSARSAMRWTMAVGALALATSSPHVWSQTSECAKQPASERLKCEQAARVAALCGDFAGAARSACEKHFVDTPALDDCGRLDGYGRTKCETYNLNVLAEFPCAGKAGATLALCAREQAQKVPQEK